jgi:hypothetical protein
MTPAKYKGLILDFFTPRSLFTVQHNHSGIILCLYTDSDRTQKLMEGF